MNSKSEASSIHVRPRLEKISVVKDQLYSLRNTAEDNNQNFKNWCNRPRPLFPYFFVGQALHLRAFHGKRSSLGLTQHSTKQSLSVLLIPKENMHWFQSKNCMQLNTWMDTDK